MHKLLLFIFIICSFNFFAQATKIKIKKEKETKKEAQRLNALNSMTSIDVCYGNMVYKDKFYNQLNTRDSFNINTAPILLGIGVSGLERSVGATHFVFEINGKKYLERQIIINDSIKTIFSGASFGMGVGKRFTTQNRNLSVTCYLGFNSGRCTLKNSENVSMHKQFFCPKITVQPKLMIKRIAISLTIEAQGDPTSGKWTSTYSNKKDDVNINALYQTSIIGLVGLGYRIYYF